MYLGLPGGVNVYRVGSDARRSVPKNQNNSPQPQFLKFKLFVSSGGSDPASTILQCTHAQA